MYISFHPDFIKLILMTIGVLGGLISAILAIISYRQRTRKENAEWLEKLALRFYHEIIPPIRIAVGQVGTAAMKSAVKKRLKRDITALSEEEVALLENLDRYFIFFEFLQHLFNENILKSTDINVTFGWHLAGLETNGSTRQWLHNYYPGLISFVMQAQKWIIRQEVALFRQEKFDESVLRERLCERLGKHNQALELINVAIARANK